MLSEGELAELNSAVETVRGNPLIWRIYAALVTGENGGYSLYFAYSMGGPSGSCLMRFYAARKSESLIKEPYADEVQISEENGRTVFRGNEYSGIRDAQGNEQQQAFIADRGYQELTGAIRSTFLEPHMILQIVRAVQKRHYPILSWLVEHGVKVFYEYVGIDADVLIGEYVLPAMPPN